MRRHGASRAAATAFLLSTPQTGVDSIAATYALLGPVFAVFRPVAALVSGMLGGMLVLLFGESKQERRPTRPSCPPAPSPAARGDRSRHVLLRAVRYGFVTLPRDLAAPCWLGVLIAGAMAVLVPPHRLHAYLGGGLVSILLLMAVGHPALRLRHRLGAHRRGSDLPGRLARRGLGLPHRRPGHQPRHLHHVWKVLGRRTALLYLLTVAAQRRRLRAAAGPALRLRQHRPPAARSPTCMP